jgi:hypothetical protein
MIRQYLPSASTLADIGFKGPSNDLVSKADTNNLGRLAVPGEIGHIVHQLVNPGQVIIGVAG